MNMMGGIQPEQGPPLAVPMRLFALGAIGLVLAGLLLLVVGPQALTHRLMPATLAFTHLITLGFFAAVMLGALHQMVPVVAGTPLPGPGLAAISTAGLALGTGLLCFAFMTGEPGLYLGAGLSLSAALLAFLGPLAIALTRAPTRSATVQGLRLAAIGLLLVLGLGLMLSWARAGQPAQFSLARIWSLHVAFGALICVAGLILPVSWQVLPMFYTAPPVPTWVSRLSLGVAGLGIVGGLGAAALDAPQSVNLAFFVPMGLVVFILTPAVWAWQIRGRRRRRSDPSLHFWKLACAIAPLVGLSWLWASFSHDPRADLLAGWAFFVAWGSLIVHGMLTRIVPFLVWFHRFSALMGKQPVPPMRQLWPDTRIHKGLALHLLTVGLGALAIGTGWAVAAHLAGLGLAGVGAWLLYGFVAAHRAAPQ